MAPSIASKQRQREKEASRQADEQALMDGADARELEAKNAFLLADRTLVHWSESESL